ncbi:MAG: hypothetical protein HRT44_06660 [Bdellovibrionales bacterium]|nr:hypothetical protein [Bdellovibrionales bacterium]NQZ18921.1 hypothetical protein [Bdellovibrionales bacterium]
MNNENKNNKEPIDRILLTKKSSSIITDTIKFLTDKHPGITITKKDLVNWLVSDHFQKLTPSTEKQLFEKFYDEIKYLEKSLRELKKKKKNGEDISIEKILKQAKQGFKQKSPRKPQAKKEKDSNDSLATKQEASTAI